MTDSGQPTEGGPGARTRADFGLTVHRQTRAVSPQSESCTCNGPMDLEAGTGPARRACKEPHFRHGTQPEGHPHSPGPGPVRGLLGTCGTTGPAGRAQRAGQQDSESVLQRPSGRPRARHRQSRTRGPLSVHRSPEPAAVRGTARMDSENPAQASEANHSGPRRFTRPRTGARNREPRVSHTLAR